jgi:hypothetical protein
MPWLTRGAGGIILIIPAGPREWLPDHATEVSMGEDDLDESRFQRT